MILLNLICGHRDQGSMRDVELTRCWCHQCSTYKDILTVETLEWFSRCYDCKYRKWHGLNKDLAKLAANAHWQRNNSHRVTHAKGSRPEARLAQEKLEKRLGVAAPLEK